ncbi:hypothetical protein SHJG_0943 [Streptomyces hygroscopicus subsp. jinggangensis 5008]|nr:hypothetical protein SHJG_0943 [Streptomyces hygroscopicus subsp. jinggangensis 5008]AGF60442.1 hypothetical protein SHJGH_0776 [Streptomyces hygroscopicus subsp. jinggangensis TL01]
MITPDTGGSWPRGSSHRHAPRDRSGAVVVAMPGEQTATVRVSHDQAPRRVQRKTRATSSHF